MVSAATSCSRKNDTFYRRVCCLWLFHSSSWLCCTASWLLKPENRCEIGQLVWWSGIVVSALASINEVNLSRARLVLRWATVSGYNSRCWTLISVCNQPATQGQLSLPSLRVGKWVPAAAGKAKAGMVHSVSGCTRSSTNGMNHTCLCLPSRSWYSFTDPGGMEGWVGLGWLVGYVPK